MTTVRSRSGRRYSKTTQTQQEVSELCSMKLTSGKTVVTEARSHVLDTQTETTRVQTIIRTRAWLRTRTNLFFTILVSEQMTFVSCCRFIIEKFNSEDEKKCLLKTQTQIWPLTSQKLFIEFTHIHIKGFQWHYHPHRTDPQPPCSPPLTHAKCQRSIRGSTETASPWWLDCCPDSWVESARRTDGLKTRLYRFTAFSRTVLFGGWLDIPVRAPSFPLFTTRCDL